MKTTAPWKRNTTGDPEYPWPSHVNEAGVMIYLVPLEAPEDLPLDSSAGAEQYSYTWLPLFGGKRMRVYWVETDNKEAAYDQKCWIDAEAKRIERRPKHEISVAELRDYGPDDGNRKKEWKLLDTPDEWTPDEDPENSTADEWEICEEAEDETDDEEGSEETTGKTKKKEPYKPYRFPQTEQLAIARMELEQVSRYIEARNPRWWRAFFLKEMYGADAKEIAEELGIEPSRVYQLVNEVQKLGRQYREENR